MKNASRQLKCNSKNPLFGGFAWGVCAPSHQRPGRGPYQLLKGESEIHPSKADMDPFLGEIHPSKADMDPFLGAGGFVHKPPMPIS